MPTLTARLNETDQVLHSLAQLLALTGTNALPTQPDDSQANLGWNPDQQQLEGRPFSHGDQTARLVIDLPTVSLQFLDTQNQPVATFSAETKTPADARAWWAHQLHNWGVGTEKPLSYHLETAPVPADTPYPALTGLTDWANWRTLAHKSLATLNEVSGRSSDIRIWPHHFDTGVYYSIPDGMENEKAAIWAGYAVADAVSSEPYFYLSGYTSHQPVDFTAATRLTTGTWLATPDWKGACLPVSEVVDLVAIDRFFEESYRWIATQTDA